MALLQGLPTSTIAEVVRGLNSRLYINFFRFLPAETCLKIFSYLDAASIARAMQTCRAWHDLLLDRGIWERLYFLEGWRIAQDEIEAAERSANDSPRNSDSHLHRLPSSEGQVTKIRALLNDDEEMTDSSRLPTNQDSGSCESIFSSPASSFTSNKRGFTLLGDRSLDETRSKSLRLDGSIESSKSKGKQRELSGSPDLLLPSILPYEPAVDNVRSSLWMWDSNTTRYRVNWKYLYNMRRRLETNWERGNFTTFQVPHPLYPEDGHKDCIYTLQFDKDYVVSGSRDHTMRVWNVHTQMLVRPALCGHHGSVLCLQFDSDPMEDLLVSGSSDSNVIIWKFSTGEILQRLTKAHSLSVLNVRFDKRILVTSSKDKTIKIFNRRPLHPGDMGYPPGQPVISSTLRSVKMYGVDPDIAQELPVIPPFTNIRRLDGHHAAVNAVQIRDKTIVSVSGDRSIKMWDWPEQICERTIPAHKKGIACVEFDGRRIVSGSSDWQVCVFDPHTGLRVAQLGGHEGHGHLVRTVQADFADLPYSVVEDEAEAKAVDDSYYQALERGEIDPDVRQQRRSHRRNAGSSLPRDIEAVGAKLPPGGGGGKRYGRIVSGSYDQSIIIWRRDKDGVWKPGLRLRQEEAAAAAQRGAAAQAAGISTGHPQSISISQLGRSQAATPDQLNRDDPVSVATRDTIDQVVPLGPEALQQFLGRHPRLLGQYDYLQTAIEREPDMMKRSLMKQVASTALRQPAARLTTGGFSQLGYISPPAAFSSSAAAAGGSSSSGFRNSDGSRSYSASLPGTSENVPTCGTSISAHASTSTYPAQQLPPTPVLPLDQAATTTVRHVEPQPASLMAHHLQPHSPPSSLHPHISAADNMPAWVFKVQFDPRRIVCCSKSRVIVGWDFCNGDAELESASRFFSTAN